jgi:hypothetical protein
MDGHQAVLRIEEPVVHASGPSPAFIRGFPGVKTLRDGHRTRPSPSESSILIMARIIARGAFEVMTIPAYFGRIWREGVKKESFACVLTSRKIIVTIVIPSPASSAG